MLNKEHSYKILLLNAGYFTGIDGSAFDYVTKFYRFLFLARKTELNLFKKLESLIHAQSPDIICLIEVTNGKRIKSLLEKEYPFRIIETKYGKKSLLRRIPFFSHKSTMILSRTKIQYEKRFLKYGTKKLVYILTILNGLTLVVTHLSLNKKNRAKNFSELASFVNKRSRSILCGDLNILSGYDELNTLTKKLDMSFAHRENTFPAYNPRLSLDLFLHTKDIEAQAFVLNSDISDHLPVILKIKN